MTEKQIKHDNNYQDITKHDNNCQDITGTLTCDPRLVETSTGLLVMELLIEFENNQLAEVDCYEKLAENHILKLKIGNKVKAFCEKRQDGSFIALRLEKLKTR